MKILNIVMPILIFLTLLLLVITFQNEQNSKSSRQIGWVSNAKIKQPKIKTNIHKPVNSTKNLEATVDVSLLNIREKPNLISRVVGKLTDGTKITVQEEQSQWAKILSPAGIQGWVYKTYIKNVESPSQPDTKSTTGKIIDLSRITFPNNQEPLKGKTIVLDPGHGGNDNGTTSIVGTHEKTLTLETAQLVDQKLKNAGANVIMTRTNDTYIPLQQRANLSNQNHADAFISLHYNWSNDRAANGLTDFYYKKSKDDGLASNILNEVAQTTRLANDGTSLDNLDVLRNNSQPSTLIELGFLSNKQDDSVVESAVYRNNVAQGIYLGLLDYFSIKNKYF